VLKLKSEYDTLNAAHYGFVWKCVVRFPPGCCTDVVALNRQTLGDGESWNRFDSQGVGQFDSHDCVARTIDVDEQGS
jgi:hypothetical protein